MIAYHGRMSELKAKAAVEDAIRFKNKLPKDKQKEINNKLTAITTVAD
jgi:hypothetical protein